MGGIFSGPSQSGKLVENAVNNISQTSIESCNSLGTAEVDNSNIIINGASVGGNVGITTAVILSNQCVMQNSLDTNVENILNGSASQTQLQESSFLNWFAAGDKNNVTVQQDVTNNISQTLASTCQSTASSNVANSNVIVNNSSVGGNVMISASTTVNNQCNITNLGRIISFNNIQGNISQSQASLDIFGLISLAIIAVVFIIVVIILILIFLPLLRGGGGKTTERTEVVREGAPVQSSGSQNASGGDQVLQVLGLQSLFGSKGGAEGVSGAGNLGGSGASLGSKGAAASESAGLGAEAVSGGLFKEAATLAEVV